MKKIIALFLILMTAACASFDTLISSVKGQGQVIYHWEKPRTGVKQFARDHSECLEVASPFSFFPDIKSFLHSEEFRIDARADWHSDRGIWASYVPYPGAMPLVLNSLKMDDDINPRKYRLCMEARGYAHRKYDIPSTTNIYHYSPQRISTQEGRYSF